MSIKYTPEELAAELGIFAPTPEQKLIIEAPQEPALVVAGAGSGKTETMASRFVYLVANRLASPHQILGLTFTRKAATELRERVMNRLRALEEKGLWAPASEDRILGLQPVVSTYNSYSANLVKEYGYRIGVSPDTTLIGDAHRWMIMEELVRALPYEADGGDFVDRTVNSLTAAALSLASSLGDHSLQPAQARQGINQLIDEMTAGKIYSPAKKIVQDLTTRAALMDVVTSYQDYKLEHGLIDFSDQISLAHQIVTQDASIAAREAGLYTDILLDEFQDTSVIQLDLLASIFAGKSVTAVGDPLQAIYGWRGASSAALETFQARFGGGKEVSNFTLSTSWRNDEAILNVANQVARELRPDSYERAQKEADFEVDVDALRGGGYVQSPQLQPRAANTGGLVEVGYFETEEAEAARVAAWLKGKYDTYQAEAAGDETSSKRVPSTAILCRKRADMGRMQAACQELNLPAAVLGTGGLLGEPIIQDLLAALQVAEDNSRATALLRLLTKWNLGAADIYRLARWARKDRVKGVSAASATIIDVIDSLTGLAAGESADKANEHGRLSDEARQRCLIIAQQIRELRRTAGLSLVDRVRAGIRIFNLDVEAMVNPNESSSMRALDQFLELAQEFMENGSHASLSQFLGWLEVAEKEERGLEGVTPDPVPGAVNILTIHAAKGLEWDFVVVPALNEGDFPGKAAARKADSSMPKQSGWLSGITEMPFPLRGDYQYLPQWQWVEPATAAEEKNTIDSYRQRLGVHALREERRLAYVAFTRARTGMLLTGSYLSARRKTVSRPSTFMTQVLNTAGLRILAAENQEGSFAEPPTEERVEAYQQAKLQEIWPPEATPLQQQSQQVAEKVQQLIGHTDEELNQLLEAALEAAPEEAAEKIQRARHDVKLLLAEQAAQREEQTVTLPLQTTTATSLPSLLADRQRALLNLRRPMPSITTESTHLGNLFHAWVERELRSSASLLDDEPTSLPVVLTEAEGRKLAAWKKIFHQLPLWQTHEAVEVEHEYVTQVGGVNVICRIDAVVKNRENGKIMLVDWKTGRVPKDQEHLFNYAVQLHLYRLAYAKKHQIPLSELEATLVFFGENGRTVSYQELVEKGVLGEDPQARIEAALNGTTTAGEA
ncbi:ATP-dependent DNA helicase [Boudabousia marimammalium]|uniref:DNA 3'-5' helicase n=1 Tax=Boudabousia marimammalium TaxID=156892 RepID=A0A1Q5PM12_9ACTO|nr:ATP-dependent DNA helicase [Boudabousia marimammalium]OKL48098.1 hypothetical protein BM477_06465 [Boudabousia marimammalium]